MTRKEENIVITCSILAAAYTILNWLILLMLLAERK